MVFHDVVEDEHYDLVIGDEAWDVDYFLHENPELKRFAFAWMTDFVGWLPMPDGGAHEAALTADYNAEMIEQRARYRRIRDRSIFVGDPDDIVPDAFGPGLPGDPRVDRGELRVRRLRHRVRPDRARRPRRAARRARLPTPTSACASSPSAAPASAATSLRRVVDAVPAARRVVDGLRFVVVAGPRIDPRSLPRRAA